MALKKLLGGICETVGKLHWSWVRFWMRVAGIRYCRRVATRLAVLCAPPYFQRHALADLNPRGFIAPGATLSGSALRLGANVFIDDGVLLYQDQKGGAIEIGDRVRLQDDTYVQTTE